MIESDAVYEMYASFLNAWSKGKVFEASFFPITNQGCYGFDFTGGPFPLNVFSETPAVSEWIAADYLEKNSRPWAIDFSRVIPLLLPNVRIKVISPATPEEMFRVHRSSMVGRLSYPGMSPASDRAGLYFDAYGKHRVQIGWAISMALKEGSWFMEHSKVLFH